MNYFVCLSSSSSLCVCTFCVCVCFHIDFSVFGLACYVSTTARAQLLCLVTLGLPCDSGFSTLNGVAGGAGTVSGGSYAFACANGYAPSGAATCTLGAWNTPTCDVIAEYCAATTPANAQTGCSASPLSGSCVITCNSGYAPKDSSSSCSASTAQVGVFDPAPECVGTSNSTVRLLCSGRWFFYRLISRLHSLVLRTLLKRARSWC